MRILCVGDSHCNPVYMKVMYQIAADFDCDALFQVGDFGYWPTTRWGGKFLEECTRLATKSGKPLYWLDGNHEDHNSRVDLLDNYHDRFISVRKNVFYSPRGHSWEWDGVKFLSLGGAYSIRSLIIGQDDFGNDEILELRGEFDGPQHGYFKTLELLNRQEIDRARSHGKVDVVLSHDVASTMHIDALMNSKPDEESRIESHEHRVRINRASMEIGQPSLFIHGHYHYPYSQNIDDTKFVGLAHDRWQQRGHERACFWVIDTLDFRKPR